MDKCIVLINVRNNINQVKDLIHDTFIFKNKYELILIDNNEKLDDINKIFNLNLNCIITDNEEKLDQYEEFGFKNIIYITKNNYSPNIYHVNFDDPLSSPYFRICFLRNNRLLNAKRDYVSCICPTYNRSNFLPLLIKLFHNQTYSQDNMELIILDDSTDNNMNIIKELDKYGNIRYFHSNKKMKLGKKRNILHQLARGEYIVCFDDDDYYPPTRVEYAINKLKNNDIKIGGCSCIDIYYTNLDRIMSFGPYGKNHATNGTFAYHRKYIYTNFYDDNSEYAEERIFLKNYKENIIQFDKNKTILCISHNNNTFDKNKIIKYGKLVNYNIENIINDSNIINYYRNIYK